MIYFKILAALFVISLVCVGVPMFVVLPEIGIAVVLSLPIMAFVSASWMAPVQFIKMSNWNIVLFTIGMIPLRIIIVCAYAWWCNSMGINQLALIIAMMWHWMLFSVPELILMYKMGIKRYNLSTGK